MVHGAPLRLLEELAVAGGTRPYPSQLSVNGPRLLRGCKLLPYAASSQLLCRAACSQAEIAPDRGSLGKIRIDEAGHSFGHLPVVFPVS